MQEIADFSLLWSRLLLIDYNFTKDKEFLKRYYPIAKAVLERFAKYEREDGLLEQVADKWNLVDWPENLRDNYDFTLSRPVVAKGCHNVINALYLGALKTLNEIEALLDLPKTGRYSEKLEAFYRAFLDKETGLFVDSEGSSHSAIHSNIYPLYFEMQPKDSTKKIVDFLKEKGLCCGVFMSYFFLKGIAKTGAYQTVFDLLVNESEHGWINMLREGATTCFEAWGKEQKWNTSLCHPWGSAPIPIIIEDLLGVSILCNEDGEATYTWNPKMPETVKDYELCLAGKSQVVRLKKETSANNASIN